MKKTLILIFALGLMSCDKDDKVYSIGNPLSIGTGEIIQIAGINTVQLEADSATTAIFTIKIHPESGSQSRDITVTTSLGTFPNGKSIDTISANQNGVATADLLSSVVGQAQIKFTIGGISVDTSIKFVPALPDDMLMHADKYLADTNQSVIVTNTLFRAPGRGVVSNPAKVNYSITPQPSFPAPPYPLVYNSFTFSQKGKAEVIISNPFKVTGYFFIHAQTNSASGGTITRTIPLIIQ